MEPSSPPRSCFTYRHLTQLSKSSVDCPLRVVAHVDLDAFYAQCEMKRLGVSREESLAVQQWENLIAVNYPARAKGVSRHITAAAAKILCPEIRLVHVAVWLPGQSNWTYTATPPSISLAKASLDPYRAESKKILAVFRSSCPDAILEKAGIDESFLDLSKPVYNRLVAEYCDVLQVKEKRAEGELNELLPLPPKGCVEWAGSHLVPDTDVDEEGTTATTEEENKEEQPLDWDDIALSIGAQMVKKIRDDVWLQLGYTCGGGIARNKMLAKLGSAFKKPNQQSVVRTSAIQPFLNRHKYTKIRNLGGKLGTRIVNHLNSESLTDLYQLSLPDLTAFLSDDTATWVYNTIRGIDRNLVTPRTQIKSMLSAKSFRPPYLPTSIEDAQKWIHVFVADIYTRIETEADEDEGGGIRRPRVMSLSFVSRAGVHRSRQTTIPSGGGGGVGLRETMVKTAESLLRWILEESGVCGNGDRRTWPCTRMSLDVGGFEERETGCGNIGNFFTRARPAIGFGRRIGYTPGTRMGMEEKGEKEKENEKEEEEEAEREGRKAKRVKTNSPPSGPSPALAETTLTEPTVEGRRVESSMTNVPTSPFNFHSPLPSIVLTALPTNPNPDEIICDACGAPISLLSLDEHRDWHVAKELSEQWRREESETARPSPPPAQLTSASTSTLKGRKTLNGKVAGSKGRGRGMEKGQTVLKF